MPAASGIGPRKNVRFAQNAAVGRQAASDALFAAHEPPEIDRFKHGCAGQLAGLARASDCHCSPGSTTTGTPLHNVNASGQDAPI